MIDWTKHELIVEHHGDGVVIHTLKKPRTMVNLVSFVNIEGHGLLVTGDRGHWSFCRRFTPSAGGRVSQYYWIEKLKIANNSQNPYQFDHDELKREISNMVSGVEGEPEIEEMKSFAASLRDCYNPFDLQIVIHAEIPSFMDYDDCPDGLVVDYDLQVVFSAFDEICRRLGEKCCDAKKSG